MSKMLKVLIVDDDAVSRTVLKTMIHWESAGFYIMEDAHNGNHAVQLIQKETPDIIITDINMPGLNGIGLIEYLEKNFPQISIIALSAYDDFDYVRQSMKNGAMDYVLKHRLDASFLLNILNTARNSIHSYWNERDRQSNIDKELTTSKAVLRQTFIRKLLEGSLSDVEEITGRLHALDVKLETENLMVTIAEIDDFRLLEEKFSSQEVDVVLHTFMEISKEILKDWEKSVIVHMAKGKFAIIFSLGPLKSTMYIYNTLYTILNRVRSEIKKYLNITACFGVSKVCTELTKLPQAYNHAETVLRDKFYKGKNSIFIESTPHKKDESFFCLDIKDEKAIYAALKNQDEKEVKSRLDVIFGKISSMRLGSKSTQMICAELINIVNKICKDTGIEIARLYTAEDIPYNLIQKYETLMDIKAWVVNLYDKLISMLRLMKLESGLSNITKKAVEYIHRNYSSDFSLKDVADFAGASSSYISRLFKEECRIGFAEYLNHVRVEYAKQCIENGELKLKEIVSSVGFNNYNYFFKVFREVTGMTPLEYEQSCRK
ncbi:response regulator [Paenibacillus radicis (ex Xue et al. 2023)]|uniref:Response regulator n=1 Tax=Paenibacillus radicis (ex Xue et al. 2023) TaxID=2972489 RepID=A0ABT1YI15_9BACL|nr:response regulator [Paenibacillus radicis (ex Xue et al. 2023)]MCR8632829.1 response regulator [Paenibacillus radicis (ex Xue et al. 2023)]